jgi:hypothetical protein
MYIFLSLAPEELNKNLKIQIMVVHFSPLSISYGEVSQFLVL